MSERIDQARRSALRLTGLAVAGIAGCATDDSSDETGPMESQQPGRRRQPRSTSGKRT